MMKKKVEGGRWKVEVASSFKLQASSSRAARGFTPPSEKDRERSRSWSSNESGAKPSTFNLQPSTSARGFTLLLAVLVSGILLTLGLAIYNIVIKDLVLSSSGRESQFAFYAADSGIECALYWDGKHDAFSAESTITEFNCGEVVVTPASDYDAGLNILTTTFSIALGQSESNACSTVSVKKHIGERRTVVESLGYNTCVLTHPRRIERAIRVQY